MTGGTLPTYTYGPHASAYNPGPTTLFLPCSAWHLSSFGGLQAVKKKVNDNKDPSRPPSQDDLDRCVMAKTGIAGSMPLHRVLPSASTYPQVPHALEEDPDRFRLCFGNSSAR